VNRHHSYSILVQAVCDDELLFRDVYVGQPGSMGDARMFERSPLSDNLLSNPHLILDEHLLGDGAYLLTKHVSVIFDVTVCYGNLHCCVNALVLFTLGPCALHR